MCNPCYFSSLPPPQAKRRKQNQSNEGDRFIPLRPSGIGALVIHSPNEQISSIYQRTLSTSLLGSSNPPGERIFHYTKKTPQPRFPTLFREPPHPKLSISKVQNLPDFTQDPNHQPLAYSSDCLGVIMGSSLYLQKKEVIQELPFEDANPPTGVAFGPKGDTLLLRLQNGHLLHYSLKFRPNEIQFQKTWETDLAEETIPLLAKNTAAFLGTKDGRICRIDSERPDVKVFYLGSSLAPILRLASHKSFLLTGNTQGKIDLFDTDKEKPLSTLEDFDGQPITALAFSSCDRYFTASGGGKIVFCSLANKKIQKLGELAIESPASAIFWQDGLIVSTHADGKARTFRIALEGQTSFSEPKSHPITFNGNPITHAILEQSENSTLLLAASVEGENLFRVALDGVRPKPKPQPLESSNRYSEIR